MKTLKPTGNLVILAPIKTTQLGSIKLPEQYDPPQQLWRVLKVGPGARKHNKKGVPHGTVIPPDVKPGDKVLTRQIPNHRHKFSDGVIVLDANEIIAVFE